jgi:hypothetical protein
VRRKLRARHLSEWPDSEDKSRPRQGLVLVLDGIEFFVPRLSGIGNRVTLKRLRYAEILKNRGPMVDEDEL